jgi:hypothetical protein
MTPPKESQYATPAAMRRGLTAQLRHHAAPRGRWALADLQRQYAYDRLLDRLYRVNDGWVVKGATALLARHIAVRHTIDIDMYLAATIAQAERDLRNASGLDLGDWMRFEVGPGRPAAASGLRLPVKATIGTTQWAAFHVDLVGEGIKMTGTPDDVPPLTPITIPGRKPATYRAYPLVDHVADKTCAILERHGTDQLPSTRYKDLIDLVAMVTSIEVTAAEQGRALSTEAERRGIALPQRFTVPDRGLWEPNYAKAASRARNLSAQTLDQALAAVCPFLDPLLQHTASGRWAPLTGQWRD